MRTTEEIFNTVRKWLNVNYFQKTESGYRFTYHREIKTWSHRVELLTAENGSTFLITARRLKIQDFEKFLFQEFNKHEANYKIPIQNASQAIEILRKYDHFKYS